jgi:hypothetical protein
VLQKASRHLPRVAAALVAAGCLHAGQIGVSWVGPGGTGGTGNWSTAIDWSTGVVPNNGGGNTYAVTIDNAPNTSTVTLDISPTIDSLTMGSLATLVTNAGTSLTMGTLNSSGNLFLDAGAALHISGSLTNSGTLVTNQNNSGGVNSITIGGTLINSAGANFILGNFNNTTDSMSAASLSNSGNFTIGRGASFNVTSGVTDVVVNSAFDIQGSFTSGVNSGLVALNSIEGQLFIRNGQTTAITPGSGTLTIASSGVFGIESSSTLNLTGDVNNSGTLETNRFNTGGGTTANISGTLTNNAGASVIVGNFNNTTDVMNVGTLVNNGALTIGTGATLHLTTQTGGLTTINSGSFIDLQGSFTAGSGSAIRSLDTVSGQLFVSNGQTTSVTPGGGTLTIGSNGVLDTENVSTLTLNGGLNNSGTLETNRFNRGGGNIVTITGTLTNNSNSQVIVGNFDNTNDIMNAGSLVNNGAIQIGHGATLNLTTQTNGLTSIAAGSSIDLRGSLTAGGGSAIRNLATVDGQIFVSNGQTTAVTPGGGVLTVSGAGVLDVEGSSTLTLNGDLNNSGVFETNRFNRGGGNTVNITGGLINALSGQAIIGNFDNTTDVVNAGTLTNNGSIQIGHGATLNLTTQINGLTDIVAGSGIDLRGSFTAGGGSAIRNLASIEGQLFVSNGQTTAVTPGSGTLTVSSSGVLDVEASSTLTLNGNLNNTGTFETNRFNRGGGNTVNITGGLINNSSGQVVIGNFDNTTDVVNAGTLTNNGSIQIGHGATLNLTAQPLGITDVAAGSGIDVRGSFTAGSGSAVRNLRSIEGQLLLSNGQTTPITPGGGTMTISSTGVLDTEAASTITITGNVDNSGVVESNRFNRGGTNHLDVSGTFTNEVGGQVIVGQFNDTTDEMSFSSLVNNGAVTVGQGATLNLDGPGTSTNNSSIVLNGGKMTLSGELDNSGTVQTNQFENAGSSFTGGVFINLTGGTFDLNGGSDTAEFATLGNGGTVNTVAGSLVTVGSGPPAAAQGLDVLANGNFEELLLSNGSFGVMNILGPAMLNGTLDIELLNGFLPGVGSSFTFLHFTPGTLSGAFANIQGQTFNNGTESWQVIYDNAGGDVRLQVAGSQPAGTPEPSTLILVGGVLLGLSRLRRKR